MSSKVKLGTLGESLRLDEDSMSVSRVVWLPLVVELEVASPESLRGSSTALVRASSGDNCCWEGLRRPNIALCDFSRSFFEFGVELGLLLEGEVAEEAAEAIAWLGG